jgi:DNA invertase Pin-like site-specific DNA recombinase
MKIGYARVSTTGQSLDTQLEALKLDGCDEIFQEKESGKAAETREQLQAALKFVRKGDMLVVTKLDRLARSVSDLWRLVNQLETKGAALKVIDQPLIDTSKAEGKVIITLFSYVAETERNLILERTAEGRLKAKAKGVKFGAKPKLSDAQLLAAINEFKQSTQSSTKVAEKHGISRSSLYRLMKQHPPPPVDS